MFLFSYFASIQCFPFFVSSLPILPFHYFAQWIFAVIYPFHFLFYLSTSSFLLNYVYSTVPGYDLQWLLYSFFQYSSRQRVSCTLFWKEVKYVGHSNMRPRISKRRCQRTHCIDAVWSMKTQQPAVVPGFTAGMMLAFASSARGRFVRCYRRS